MQTDLQNIGPVSTYELSHLKDFFELNGIEFETEIDDDLKLEADRQLELHGNGDYDFLARRVVNTFDYKQARIFYVYLKSEDALRSKSFLHDLSLTLNRDNNGVSPEVAEELLNAEDYLCSDCSYQSLKPGTCPEHGKSLLSYYDWVRAKNERENILPSNEIVARNFWFFALVAFIVGVVALISTQILVKR